MSCTVFGVGTIGKTKRKDDIRVYKLWQNMLSRCYYEKSNMYHRYGAIGVKVCDRWLYFDNFVEDLSKIDGYIQDEFYNGNLHLDKDIKINGNKLYSLEHCTFATQQENNKFRDNFTVSFVAISPDNEIFFENNYKKFSEKHNLSMSGISQCLSGKRYTLNMWIFVKEEDYDCTIDYAKFRSKKYTRFKAISPSGEVFIAESIASFAKEHGLTKENISKYLNNKISKYRNWHFEKI